MNTSISQDKFSWHRVAMIARYHYPNLRLQIILYPIISIVLGLLISLGSANILSSGNSPAGVGALQIISTIGVGISSLVLSFMFYFSPATFCRPAREVEVSIPALWSEKATFTLLYLFVFIPLILYLPTIVIRLIFDVFQTQETVNISAFGVGFNLGSQWFTVEIFNSLVPLAVCAYVVISRPKASFGRAAAMSIIALVGVGIINTVAVLITAFPELMSISKSDPDQLETIIKDSDFTRFNISRYIVTGLSAVIAVIFIWLTARSYKKIQL